MSTTAAIVENHEVIKIEDSPEPVPPTPTLVGGNVTVQPFDPKDPEGFLRRCSGYIKKKGIRCSAVIGRNSIQNSHSTYLPTCHIHKDQQSYAGWCQFVQQDGGRCGRLFRWTPPYFELCAEHQGHPDTPCYFMRLPLELRLEIFLYLLPSRAIGSSTSLLHIEEDPDQQQPWYHLHGHTRIGSVSLNRNAHCHRSHSPLDRPIMRSAFPVPFLDLLLINRQVHDEVKDLLYSTVPFTVDVRKDGTFMCGRRLLEPRRADGSSHYLIGDVEKIKEKFLKTFDWAAVKNYNVDILVENWKDDTNRGYHTFPWDEEVEIYDIRDYIGVVVSGILSKARNLCKLNVRLGVSKFVWTDEELHKNIKTLVGPFERLRNVRQPRFVGVYEGTPQTNFMISLPIPSQAAHLAHQGPSHARPSTPLCSVPQLPTKVPLILCSQPVFSRYRANWERWISSTSPTSLVCKPPIRAMFTELKEFYTRLAATVPDVATRNGRHAFLHRARVAREHEDVEAFRHLRNELIAYWEAYLEMEERRKDDMNRRLSRMLDVDVYPASFDEDDTCVANSSSEMVRSLSGSGSQSPIIVNADSWHNAVRHTQPHTRPTSLSRPRPQTHASSSKSVAGSSTQPPVIINLAEETKLLRERERIANIRLQISLQQQQHQQSLQRDGSTLQSPTTSDGPISPGTSSQPALQQSKDQQPMALNPQLHFEAAMSHRRQVEMQIYRARAMQEAMRQRAMEQARTEAAQNQQSAQNDQSAFSALVSQPHRVGMLTMPMEPAQRQFRDVAERSSASLPASPSPGLHHATMMPIPRPHPQFAVNAVPADLGFEHSVTIPNNEPASCGYDVTSQLKRRSSEADETVQVKRQRVDSGMGWAGEESYSPEGHRGVGKSGHEAGEREEQNDYERMYQADTVRWGSGAGVNSTAGERSSRGKGKERALEGDVVWLN